MTSVPIPGTAAVHPADAVHLGPVPDETRLEVTLVLNPKAPGHELRHKQEEIERLAPLSRPRLSDAERAHLHDADDADLAAVQAFAEANHLEVVPSWAGASGRDVTLAGTAGAFVSAFQTALGQVMSGHGTHIATTRAIHLPPALAARVVAVHGLDGTPHAAPLVALRAGAGGVDARDLVRDRYRTPMDTLDGSGERVAVIAFGGGYWPDDLEQYFAAVLPAGQDRPVVTPVSVPKSPGGVGPANRPTPRRALQRLVDDLNELPLMADVEGGMDCPTCSARFLATLETTMDIELVGAIAPGAAIDVYFASNDMAGYIAAIETAIGLRPGAPAPATVISISWGKGEAWFSGNAKNAITIALEKARDHGVTVVAASGDLGAVGVEPGSGYEQRANVSFPASCQWVLGCGGTTLTDHGERVWNAEWKGVPMASGGGVSGFCEAVPWQADCAVPQSALADGSAWVADGVAEDFRGRGVPDVAANADPATGYRLVLGGRETVGGGTSAAAPVWAALVALANQAINRRAAELGRGQAVRLGYANRLLYRPELRRAFHEVAEGDNCLAGSAPTVASYRGGAGWNPCTGLGTPMMDRLLDIVTAEEPLP